MGFTSILTNITTYFSGIASTNNWTVLYDNDPSATPTSGLFLEFNIDFGDSEQKEIGTTKAYRNPGNVIIKIKNDVGLGLGGLLGEADKVSAAFRSQNIGDAIFRVPRIVKVGRVNDLYQINVICPFYLDN